MTFPEHFHSAITVISCVDFTKQEEEGIRPIVFKGKILFPVPASKSYFTAFEGSASVFQMNTHQDI